MCRELTVGQMARRVVKYVPELELLAVANYIRAYREFGLSEMDVHHWVRFFDSMVIDEGGTEHGN